MRRPIRAVRSARSRPIRCPDLMVFHQRPFPQNAVDAARLTTNWIDAARRQLSSTPLEVRARALRHALGFGPPLPASRIAIPRQRRVGSDEPASPVTVIVAGIDAELEKQLRSARFTLKPIDFTPFDARRGGKDSDVRHLQQDGREPAGRGYRRGVARVAGCGARGAGDAALAGMLALAMETGRRAVLDVGDFDTSSDAAFLERLYMPGLRRAGDLVHRRGAGWRSRRDPQRRRALHARRRDRAIARS